MNSINSIVLTGNLGQDPTFKFFQSGTEMMEGRFCFRTRKRDDSGEWAEHHNWIDIKWFKPPQGLKPYLVKGRGLVLVGRLEIESWEAKDGGGKRSKPVVMIQELQLVTMRGEEGTVPLTPKSEPAGDGIPF